MKSPTPSTPRAQPTGYDPYGLGTAKVMTLGRLWERVQSHSCMLRLAWKRL